MKLSIAFDEVFLAHEAPSYHPERPERLVAILRALQESGHWGQAEIFAPREATREELTRVHDEQYVESTLARIDGRSGHLDPDTFFSPGSCEAALKAAGGGVQLVERLWSGEKDLGLALVRPPGHHAEANRAGGFCIFNNIGVAAAALHAAGAERVLVFDWDVHHGNGTQHQFEDSANLFYISVHAWPHYPGTGLSQEIGIDEGLGHTANVPYPHGANDGDYAAVMDRLVAPICHAYKPEAILVSAGFDAHRNDMLGGMDLSEAGFAYMASRIRDLVAEHCPGKCALFLEGGYDLDGLTNSLVEVLRVFDGANAGKPTVNPLERSRSVLDETLEHLSTYWPTLASAKK